MRKLGFDFEAMAKDKRALFRTLGIWGLFCLYVGKTTPAQSNQACGESFRDELARLESEFATNRAQARLAR